MVVIYNWDMPVKLHQIGGWINRKVVKHYVEYAKFVIEELGEFVDYWLTIHDPFSICMQDQWASGVHEYTCMHNVLKAHAEVYHYYKNSTTFKGRPFNFYSTIHKILISGMISIDFHSFWYGTLLPIAADKMAAERIMQFSLGWYANPIFSENGDYPSVMKERIKERCLLEGTESSRLPEFTQEEVDYIKGTADFFALSHFTSYIAFNRNETNYNETSVANDIKVSVIEHYLSSLSASDWLRVTLYEKKMFCFNSSVYRYIPMVYEKY